MFELKGALFSVKIGFNYDINIHGNGSVLKTAIFKDVCLSSMKLKTAFPLMWYDRRMETPNVHMLLNKSVPVMYGLCLCVLIYTVHILILEHSL